MEQPRYLIDTNAVIVFLGMKFPAEGTAFMADVVNKVPIVSVITRIEVLGFNSSQNDNSLLTEFMNDANVISLNDEIVDTTINIRKKHKIKLPDAIIAATAKALNLILITRNISDFKSIESLRVINAHQITA